MEHLSCVAAVRARQDAKVKAADAAGGRVEDVEGAPAIGCVAGRVDGLGDAGCGGQNRGAVVTRTGGAADDDERV